MLFIGWQKEPQQKKKEISLFQKMSDPEEKEFSESFQMVRLNTTGKSNEDKADQSDASLPQIKVFQAWMNSHLVKRNLKVNDFKKDLCDGVLLAQLLEILTNKTIPNIKTKNVGMRAFKFDNVSILLKWIDQELHLRLFGCAPEDIVDGNLAQIMGLIWALIRKFSFNVGREGGQSLSRERLLEFCAAETKNYPNVNIVDFDQSFYDGLAFGALIHNFDNSFFSFETLQPSIPIENLKLVFSIAESKLNIPQLLDPEKITETPEKSIMTYLTFFYHLYRERDEAKGELSARAIRKSFSKESLSESSTKKDSLEFIPKKNVFGENRRSRRSTDLSFTTTTTIVNKKNALDSEEATKQVDEISKLRLDTETFLKEEEQKLKLDFEKKLEEEHRKLEEERKKLLEMKSELERQKNEIQPPEPAVTRPARSNTLMNEDRLREVLKKTIEEERMAVQLEKEKFLEEERKAVQQEKDKLKKQYEEEIEALKAAQMNFLETKITSLFSELTSKIQSRDEEIASLKQMLASINVEKAKTYSLPPQKERNYPSSPIPEILVSKTSESPNNEVSQIPPEKKATGPQKGITALSPKSNRETSSPLRDFYEETSEELPEKIHIRNSNEIMNALNEESSDEGDMQSFIDFSKVNGKKRDELEETDQNSSGNYAISDDIPSKFKTEENVLLRGSWEGKDANNFSKSRYEIAAELVKTEESYVSSLKVIIEVFLDPLRKNEMWNNIVNKQDMRSIFSEIEVISGYNKLLLKLLKERMEKWTEETTLGDIFGKIIDYLKTYTQYVNNFNKALFTIHTYEKNERFVQFLQMCKSDPKCNQLDLSQFLIMPIQRIPRYVLLLEQLFQHTRPDHADHKLLKDALNKMKDVADYVNDKKREADNLTAVLCIQDKLIGEFENLAKPHRRYIKEGSLSVEVETKKKNYYFFLFNDLMIATKKKKSLTGSLKSKNPNKNVPSTLRSLNDNTIYSGSKAIIKPGQYIYKFTIPFSMQTKVIPSRDKSKVFSIKDEEKTYSFSANSGDEAKDWLTALLKVLRKLNQNAKSLEKTESHERTLSLSMPQYNVNPKSTSNNSPIRSSSPQRGSSVG